MDTCSAGAVGSCRFLFVAALLFCTLSLALARLRAQTPQETQPTTVQERVRRAELNDPVLKGIDITDTQRTQIAAIRANYKALMKQRVKELLDASDPKDGIIPDLSG